MRIVFEKLFGGVHTSKWYQRIYIYIYNIYIYIYIDICMQTLMIRMLNPKVIYCICFFCF